MSCHAILDLSQLHHMCFSLAFHQRIAVGFRPVIGCGRSVDSGLGKAVVSRITPAELPGRRGSKGVRVRSHAHGCSQLSACRHCNRQVFLK